MPGSWRRALVAGLAVCIAAALERARLRSQGPGR